MDEKFETLLLVCLAVEPAMRKPSCAKHNASCARVRARAMPLCARAWLRANRRSLPMAAHSFLPVGHLRDGDPRLPARLRPDGLQGRDALLCTRRCSCAFELTARGRQDSHAASNDHARCPPAQLFAHLREGQGRRARSRLPDSGRVAPASRLAAAEDAHRVGDTTCTTVTLAQTR